MKNVSAQNIEIQVDANAILGTLVLPKKSTSLVIFAHGSGSGRHSPRNQYVASILNEAGIATLLIDLLTEEEEQIDLITAKLRFDIKLLASRLEQTVQWVIRHPNLKNYKIGYFGASTGAGAAIMAAAEQPNLIKAIVSRGGRPDLAGEEALNKLTAPTLLLVGSLDYPVIELNEWAQARLKVENKLIIVPGATHLFEEPGTLEMVANLAADWFLKN